MPAKLSAYALLILAACLVPASAQGSPEILYYKFDGSGGLVPNLACSPRGFYQAVLNGHTQGPGGQFGGGLHGIGGSSSTNFLNTGWATDLGSGDWTLSLYLVVNASSGSTPFAYLLGDPSASSFRAFTGGAAGNGNVLLRGPFADVLVPGGATSAGATITWVNDTLAGEIRAYLDGVLVTTVPQPTAFTISGMGPFKVGGYSLSGALLPSMTIDEFRLYDRALSPTEVAAVAAQPLECIGTTGTPGINDLTINGVGSGRTSAVSVPVSEGFPMILRGDGFPNAPITVSTAATTSVDALDIGHVYSLDLDLLTHQLFLDGTGAFIPATALTPYLSTSADGIFEFAVTAAVPAGTTLALQMGFFSPSYVQGLATSQAFDVTVRPPTTTYILGDDDFVQHDLSVPVTFYGETYESLFVGSNGYVTFGSGSSDFTESEPEFFNGWNSPPNPGVALYYSDLNRGGMTNGATYEVVENPSQGTVRVDFLNQIHFASNLPAGSFSVEFGPLGPGSVVLDYAGFLPGMGNSDAGIVGITDGDASVGVDTSFTSSGGFLGNTPYVSPTGPDSICETFTPSASIPFQTLTFITFGGGIFAVDVN